MRRSDEWYLSYERPCQYTRLLVQIAQQSIFSRITDQSTQQQIQAAQQSLRELCERLERQLDIFHYGAAYGQMHTCVREAYTDCAYRLKNLAITQRHRHNRQHPDSN